MILSKHELKHATVPRPKRWDKKWRIINFDVQERKRKYRDHMRTILKTIGLVRLQDSVWIYPFPCEDIIELAKTAYRIRRDVIYLVSQRFTGDDKLAFNFGLGLNPIE
jgi:DNA-binding transcriptional regulator PaaX